jgi:diguanylate cyclase (GGDEF)-like protein
VSGAHPQPDLVVLAQPIVDLATGAPRKHELTLRLPVGGRPVMPAAVEIDDLLVRRAIGLAHQGHPVAIDVCSTSLDDPDFALRVQQAVVEAKIDPTLLTFELTEASLTTNTDAASAFVHGVHGLGCAVTLDHCGKSCAGLGYLKRLPVDCLKIDAAFIAGLDPASADGHLVRALVYLARGLGITVAADGVADPATPALLEDLGVDQAQGPLFGAPSALFDRPAPALSAGAPMTPEARPRRGHREADTGVQAYERRYGEAVRAADAAAAEAVVDEALAAGLTPSAIQSLVLEPALRGIGELWECNGITVADEHLATAISQAVLIKLFDKLSVAPPRSRERILLAAVEGQHHVVGLRMIADVLEGAGFDVLYLGANIPVDALSRFAAEHQPAVTGLAFAVSVRVDVLAESIHAVHEACPATRLMLGGRSVPQSLVAAGYPRVDNSMEVLFTVERLLREPSRPAPAMLQALRLKHRERRAGATATIASGTVASRLADVAEDASETAREYVRRAGKYKDLAFRDAVTNLGNRRAFDDRMYARAHAEPSDSDADGAVLMIDVDKFKAVNDTHGHDAGDRLLRNIGTAISGRIRSHDFAARVGGDEFAVLLPKSSLDEARAIGGRIRLAIADSADLPVTVSIGLAPLSADTRGAVLAADLALYEAKGAGRDCVIAAGSPLEPAARSIQAVS